MANNERVSQLVELFATDLQPDDVVLATDTSQKESKKIEIGQLLLYFENSGSYLLYHALTSLTASYVAGSGVDGAVAVASSATRSISSSYSDRSVSSSYASSTSFAAFAANSYTSTTNADTASFLKYTGGPNGTSSYAVNSFVSDIALTASYLLWVGGGFINGTSSYALTSSISTISSFASQSFSSSYSIWADQSFSSSWATSSIISIFSTSSSYSSGSDFSTSSSFASQSLTASYFYGYSEPIKAWATITWNNLGVTSPQLHTNYNIFAFIYANRIIDASNTTFYDQFQVFFASPLQNTNYVLMGQCNNPYGSYKQLSFPMMHPIYSNKTTTGFTMSISSISSSNDWYSSSAYVNPMMTFQILGL
jgi:hypothetical protein